MVMLDSSTRGASDTTQVQDCEDLFLAGNSPAEEVPFFCRRVEGLAPACTPQVKVPANTPATSKPKEQFCALNGQKHMGFFPSSRRNCATSPPKTLAATLNNTLHGPAPVHACLQNKLKAFSKFMQSTQDPSIGNRNLMIAVSSTLEIALTPRPTKQRRTLMRQKSGGLHGQLLVQSCMQFFVQAPSRGFFPQQKE